MPPSDPPPPLALLSYDVTKGHRSAASRVSPLIVGRADVHADETRPFIRRAGVLWIGQSVFIAPEPDARELAEKLRSLGAIVTMAPIPVGPSRFEEFRRRALGRRPA